MNTVGLKELTGKAQSRRPPGKDDDTNSDKDNKGDDDADDQPSADAYTLKKKKYSLSFIYYWICNSK